MQMSTAIIFLTNRNFLQHIKYLGISFKKEYGHGFIETSDNGCNNFSNDYMMRLS